MNWSIELSQAISIQSATVSKLVSPQSIAQVAIGGGTPTYLKATELSQVLNVMSNDWPISLGSIPFSIEVFTRNG